MDRICGLFDWYYHDGTFASTRKISANRTRVGAYPSKMSLPLSAEWGTTYLDTVRDRESNAIESIDDIKDNKNTKLTQRTIKFWGTGFEEQDYLYLNDKYEDWTARHECKTKAQESIFQKICLMEWQITKAIQKGEKVEGLMNAYNSLLGSANVKPVQNNDNTLADQNTFGTLIQKWETEKPIPEPEPEWKDVDGIIKYISIWFLGHLCKMMKIKNSYSRLYEEEMEKLKVDKPQYEDDTEALFEDVFGGDDSGS